jgi:polyhydroxyalkanoate synthesis repressor PhaR
VLDNEEFVVRDAKNDEDITRSILLQIIVEQEEKEEPPLFTMDVLQQVIRIQDDTLLGVFGKYLDGNIRLIVRQRQLFRQQVHNVMVRDPVNFLCALTEQNLSLWEEMHEMFSVKKPIDSQQQIPNNS